MKIKVQIQKSKRRDNNKVHTQKGIGEGGKIVIINNKVVMIILEMTKQ